VVVFLPILKVFEVILEDRNDVSNTGFLKSALPAKSEYPVQMVNQKARKPAGG
jgi:hypothetical protein